MVQPTQTCIGGNCQYDGYALITRTPRGLLLLGGGLSFDLIKSLLGIRLLSTLV